MLSEVFPRLGRLFFALCALAVVAAVVAACSSSDGDPTPTPAASTPDAASSGSATSPAAATPTTVSPVAPTPTPTPDALEVDISGRVGGAPGDTAPQFAGLGAWINSDPLTMEELRGEVVLIDFWTYTCINCIRTIPYLRDWHAKYADLGLTIVGVHTPEFEFEKVIDNVVASTEELGVAWPVAQDNDYRTWRAYGNRYWPAKYLIDADGVVRYTHFGEGAYDETEAHIRTLLAESGRDVSGVTANPDPGPRADPEAYQSEETRQTREIYGGWNRNSSTTGLYIADPDYYTGRGLTQVYTDPGGHLNQFIYLHGSWTSEEESIKHGRATDNLEDYIALLFYARTVNLVTDFAEDAEPYEVEVTIADIPSEDSAELAYRPLSPNEAGAHIVIEDGRSYFVVDEADLYNVVALPEFGGAELKFASNSPDFALFALTFGSYAETY